MKIHPSAIVDPAAKLGAGVEIGPGAVVEAGAVLGDGCVLGPHAVVRPFATLGPGCRVHAGAVIGDTPQDLAFKELASHVRIGARCTFREGVTVHRGTKEGTETVIGDDCYLMANSHVAHNCRLGNRVILANGSLLGGYVEIGDGAFVSGNAVIHQFCRIGRLAMIGGLSGISKDVPPFCMTHSVDMNTVVGLNIVGLKRNGFTPEQRKAVKACFALVFREGLNTAQARERLAARAGDAIAAEWLAFITGSRRGLCKFAARGGTADEE
ncbi:MAG TPA: acyl-ACP--UDP-N-acetylglucosamine O-acyltransferase [Kiritimatiellia bacterium]|nr:acyl-ACP--UDP-N-acetylglucosamine O-acyltransferase [Kiritimatiellia bacterium]HMP34703.1 acyl-ACP--UDP-N-acetylglucosamine O-acyltransferase [Kiritimatiellia bacterium]